MGDMRISPINQNNDNNKKINMANLCCTGVTECDHIITIGYLKSFVGTDAHSSTNDTPLSVSSQDDTYCPTYGELINGIFIQTWKEGGTPNGDRDGIVVGGSYDDSQLVMKKDLSIKYTRFKSFSISASPAIISECGGSSTLSYSHKYTRYEKNHTNNCEDTDITSVEVNDTSNNEVSWNAGAYGSISYPTYSIGKNGTVSASSRSTTINGSVTFRGNTHNDTLVLTQNSLTGDYTSFYRHNSVISSYDSVSVSPWDFGCEGGRWYATGYYTTHEFDVYRWVDSCGTVYNDITTNKNETYKSHTESYDWGDVDSIDCSSLSEDYSHRETVYYHGKSDWWRQECKTCSGCVDYTVYDYEDKVVDCSAGSVDVPYTYTSYTASVDSSGNCSYTEKDRGSGSYNVTWDCDTEGGQIDDHVTVTGAPCCSVCSCADLSIDSNSETWEYNDTSTKEITVSSSSCISNISVNSLSYFNVRLGNGKVTVSPKGENTSDAAYVEDALISYSADSNECEKTIKLTQKANSCTPTTCTCYKPTQATLKSGSSIGSGQTSAEVQWSYTAITWTTNAACQVSSSQTVGVSSNTVTGIAVNNTCGDIVRSGSFIWSGYKACGSNDECTNNDAVIYWSVIQDRGKSETDPECTGCHCSGLTIGSTPSAWGCSETSSKNVPYTADTCLTDLNISVTGANSDKFIVLLDTSNSQISITPVGTNVTSNAYTATVALSYKANGTSCDAKTFTLTQNCGSECQCNCSGLTIGSAPSAWGCNETNEKCVPYTADTCLTDLIVSVTGANSDKFTASLDTSNSQICVAPVGTNVSQNAYTATVTLSYKANGTSCDAKTFTLTQNSGSECQCKIVIIEDDTDGCKGGKVTFGIM